MGACLERTLFYRSQWTVIVEKRTVTQPVNKFSYFHFFRRKCCTYFSFLHAAKPLFTVGFCLNLRKQTKTNEHTHTHTRCPRLFCRPAYSRSKETKSNSANPIWLLQILCDDRSHCSCLPAARYFHKVHLHIQNSNIKKSNNQSIIRRWDIIIEIQDLMTKFDINYSYLLATLLCWTKSQYTFEVILTVHRR